MTEHGWIFDAYPKGSKMSVWLKRPDGSVINLEDDWRHSIYVGGDAPKLRALVKSKDIAPLVFNHSIEKRQERITDVEKSAVLRLELASSARALALAELIECCGDFRLYNVDLLPAQAYYYDNDIFTLVKCEIASHGERLAYELQDSQMSTDYELPDFKTMHLDVAVKKNGRLARFEDRIDSVMLSVGDERIEVDSGSESDILAQTMSAVQKIDPDFVFTAGGDAFLFPYLIHRSRVNNVSLVLGRDQTSLALPKKQGTTYFSYGRIHYRPSTIKLRGRIHIDTLNSFILDETGLQGLYEVTRLCRMPLQTASRASIGRCMTSLQFYHAWKKGLLVPWKPELAEHYKTFRQLLVADRGGLVYEPEIGVHEQAAEFDFASLYPSIMLKKNISGETVDCSCCPDSKNLVPEVGYRICKKTGIVPLSLDIILKKRAAYKVLKKSGPDPALREIYDARQTALKWILVTSFGYLGFNNSKFGRIDAHISVCAYDRQVLKQATKVAEGMGFKVLHGIVDSLWVTNPGAVIDDHLRLKDAIEKATGFDISFEGRYKWVVFLPSRASPMVAVPNRYFGLFEDGIIKVRGIEVRRHDTPEFFARCQAEVLKVMARGNTAKEVRELMPEVDAVFAKYVDALKSGKVPLDELFYTKQLSKDSSKYLERKTVEVDALRQLEKEGRTMRAGEVIRFVITDYSAKHGPRSVPEELLDQDIKYDAQRYIEQLSGVCDTVTLPFGHSVRDKVSGRQQTRLFAL